MTRLRGALGFVIVILVFGLAFPATVISANTKMTFYLNFSTPYADHIAAYVAQEMGYYTEEGLDVTIQKTSGSNDCVKIIGARRGDLALGISDSLAVLKGIVRGIPIKSITALYQSNPTVIISLKKANIHSMKDLIGKKLADAPTSSTYYFIKAGLAKANIGFTQIKFLAVENRSKDAVLMTEKADAIGGMANGQAVNITAKGHELNLITMKDMGIKGYGMCIIANENMLKQEEVIRKFMAAYIRGIRFQREKPEEAAVLFQKEVPLRTLSIVREKNKMDIKLMESEDAFNNGFGHQTKEAWGTLQDILFENKVIDKKIDAGDYFTNTFVGKAAKALF